MNESTPLFAQPIFLICGLAVFVILFVVIHEVLKQTSFFRSGTAIVVAACVSLLCLIGIHQHLLGSQGPYLFNDDTDDPGRNLNVILIPYTALGLSILFVLLLLLMHKVSRGGKIKQTSKRLSERRAKQPDASKLSNKERRIK